MIDFDNLINRFHSIILYAVSPSHKLHVNYCSIQRSMGKGRRRSFNEIIHDDFVFNPHVGGITMGKSDLLGFAGGWFT